MNISKQNYNFDEKSFELSAFVKTYFVDPHESESGVLMLSKKILSDDGITFKWETCDGS